MKYLNYSESKLFREKIKSYDKIQLNKIFKKEKTVNINLTIFLNKLESFLRLYEINNLLVYPDDEWSPYEIKFKNEPLLIQRKELKNFLKENIEFGIEDYFITDGNFKFEWVIVICNEMDFHIYGNKEIYSFWN